MGSSDKPIDEQLQELWEEQGEKIGVPQGVRDLLNSPLAKVPVSSFPKLPYGKDQFPFLPYMASSHSHACDQIVTLKSMHRTLGFGEISGDASIFEAVHLLAETNSFSALVRNPSASPTDSWSTRYLGMVDYPSIILWVLEQAELAAAAIATGSATLVGAGAGALGACGALVLGLTGPLAVAGLAAFAVGAAIAGGVAAESGMAKDGPSAADALGQDFYKVILENEPFKSMKVSEITRAYGRAPFLHIEHNDSMLTVLRLLLSKFRPHSIPVVNIDNNVVQDVITEFGVILGLSQCRGWDWFDNLAGKSLHQLGLPVMMHSEVVWVDASKLVLEAFVLMKEKHIGGLPVVGGPEHHLVGNISVRDVHFLLKQPELFAKHKELTVMDFMKTVMEQEPETGMLPPTICEITAKLGDVIEMLAKKTLTRIHIVDKSNQLVGVVTLRDIIGCFVSEPKDYFEDYIGGVFKETILQANRSE